MIMGAMCIDGKDFGPGAHQQDFLIADMAEQLVLDQCCG
ncbi:Uncharacterised protein [Mycobacterium tuberculosis]|nr:Uncharacterised protein [Mycobacterium tuberculosis]